MTGGLRPAAGVHADDASRLRPVQRPAPAHPRGLVHAGVLTPHGAGRGRVRPDARILDHRCRSRVAGGHVLLRLNPDADPVWDPRRHVRTGVGRTPPGWARRVGGVRRSMGRGPVTRCAWADARGGVAVHQGEPDPYCGRLHGDGPVVRSPLSARAVDHRQRSRIGVSLAMPAVRQLGAGYLWIRAVRSDRTWRQRFRAERHGGQRGLRTDHRRDRDRARQHRPVPRRRDPAAGILPGHRPHQAGARGRRPAAVDVVRLSHHRPVVALIAAFFVRETHCRYISAEMR